MKTIRWGILGTARIATKVSEAIDATEGARVAAVASRSMAAACREHNVQLMDATTHDGKMIY